MKLGNLQKIVIYESLKGVKFVKVNVFTIQIDILCVMCCISSDKIIFLSPWAYFWVFSPNIGPWASNIVGLFFGNFPVLKINLQFHCFKFAESNL